MNLQPSVENPLLVGLLVDVSGSMISAIENKSRGTLTRLQSFQEAFGDLASKAQQISTSVTGDRPLLFAYGFGFGNPLSALFGSPGPGVRDLLDGARLGSSTVGVSQLASKWSDFRSHVEAQAFQMFGATPMLEGIQAVTERFRSEHRGRTHAGKVLFLLSDGEPTDAPPEQIIAAARALKEDGVMIVSCFVTDRDITDARCLYDKPQSSWHAAATLMHGVSSPIPDNSSFYMYLREHNWNMRPGARLFTQINQSQLLSEFLQVVVSPLQESRADKPPVTGAYLFVSYSHRDSHWLERLKIHLSPLIRKKRIDLWDDQRIRAGNLWRDEIDRALSQASAA
ncbi:MAG: VWA domain-containing protein [Nitrospira sp.]|nr:VWA domain-containing protein [Nitrospira sp.]